MSLDAMSVDAMSVDAMSLDAMSARCRPRAQSDVDDRGAGKPRREPSEPRVPEAERLYGARKNIEATASEHRVG
jgi:hypothetical protein